MLDIGLHSIQLLFTHALYVTREGMVLSNHAILIVFCVLRNNFYLVIKILAFECVRCKGNEYPRCSLLVLIMGTGRQKWIIPSTTID